MRIDCRSQSDWLPLTLEAVRESGFAVVERALPPELCRETSDHLYSVREAIHAEIGRDRLRRAGELGVLRNMICFDGFFARFLELPEVLALVDATVSETAILHLQNGFILESNTPEETPKVFQNSFHRDFPRYLNGYLASLNVFFAIDEFTENNGSTLVVPGSHQLKEPPLLNHMTGMAQQVLCPAGTMLVFDSTLWHAAGINTSGRDRLSINHQFTRSFFKQQIDYVRALGNQRIQTMPERTKQLLGWYTRVVTSLDEYYQPADKRLYRAGQG